MEPVMGGFLTQPPSTFLGTNYLSTDLADKPRR